MTAKWLYVLYIHYHSGSSECYFSPLQSIHILHWFLLPNVTACLISRKWKKKQCYACEMLRFSVDSHMFSTMHIWLKKTLLLNYRGEECFVQIKYYSSKRTVHVGWLFYHCLYWSVSHFILWLQILLVSQMDNLQVLETTNCPIISAM